MKILVIGDSHINPAIPNVTDWQRLGEYVIKTKPDAIVHLGDVADFASLAWYKAQRGEFTTEQEMEQVSLHIKAFEDVIKAEQDRNRRDHKTIYRPEKFLCLGNHDVRQGFTGIQDLFESLDWIVADYLQPVVLDGVAFCHCMMRGLTDTPCTTAEELLQQWHGTIVVGHGHLRDYSESFSIGTQQTIRALHCPMFNSDDIGWALQIRNKWSRGFTEINTQPFQFIWRDMSCLLNNS